MKIEACTHWKRYAHRISSDEPTYTDLRMMYKTKLESQLHGLQSKQIHGLVQKVGEYIYKYPLSSKGLKSLRVYKKYMYT